MFILARALTYAVFFVGLILVYFPGRFLALAGVFRPESLGPLELFGIAISTIGAVIATWCVFTFANVGGGTPAPFDPPQELVIEGPYRYVRNPMYIGAALVLSGAAIFYRSLELLIYAGVFLLIVHVFVISYEEPTLRRTFGEAYKTYCERVRRWWPVIR